MDNKMLFGVHIFPTQFSFQPDELARAAEERGLESVWFSEHTHMPIRFLNRTSLPEYYLCYENTPYAGKDLLTSLYIDSG